MTNRKKTIFELVKVDITANVVSFSKRGMTKADTEVEDASLKKQWKKGDYLYITVLAPDIVALNKENERLASQDFTGYTQNFGNTTHTGYALFQ